MIIIIMIYKIFILFILFIFLFYYFYQEDVENFENIENIYFVKKDNLNMMLKKDEDNYYKKFYIMDFKARNIDNINQYIAYIEQSTCDFNNEEKKKIYKCILEANKKLKKINFEWFDGKKAIELPWKIGMIKGKLYENGLPHTRNDIIIISKENINNYDEKKLINTLIHEKVHIYQKKYPKDIQIYLDIHKFKKIKNREKDDNIRANPDLNNFIYQDEKKNIYKALYKNNPKTIEDIIYVPYNIQSYEHPFEKMAIYIENL